MVRKNFRNPKCPFLQCHHMYLMSECNKNRGHGSTRSNSDLVLFPLKPNITKRGLFIVRLQSINLWIGESFELFFIKSGYRSKVGWRHFYFATSCAPLLERSNLVSSYFRQIDVGRPFFGIKYKLRWRALAEIRFRCKLVRKLRFQWEWSIH